MTHEPSLWSFVANAGPIVKFVLLILLTASMWSWTVIFQRFFFFKDTNLEMKNFEKKIWSGKDLNQLYVDLTSRKNKLRGLEHIFYSGYFRNFDYFM